jgi:hypothetical protein
MTFVEAAFQVLKENNNTPMSAKEIWDIIEKNQIYKTDGKTPCNTLNVLMLSSSNNSSLKNKSKKCFYTIVSKNPIKFKLLENFEHEVIEEDFDLSDEEILSNLKDLSSASLEVGKCLNDVDYLSQQLNAVDRNYLHKYYISDKCGVVIDIRKDVAKEILLSFVNSEKINEIITKHKSINQRELKSWSNPYKILHPLINYKYKNLDTFIENFTKFICSRIGDVKYTISGFNGSQHQGSEHYWVAIYNNQQKNQSEGLQLFLSFKNGIFYYGIFNYIEQLHITEFEFDGDLNKFYDFIDSNSELIRNDTKKASLNLIIKVKDFLESTDNLGKTISEIILNLKSNISENNLRNLLIESDEFDLVGDKWKIKNQIPGTGKLKKYLTEQGFVTIDMLIELLNRNGIKLENL